MIVRVASRLSIFSMVVGRFLLQVQELCRIEFRVLFVVIRVLGNMIQEVPEWKKSYFDKFSPFLILFHAVKGMFSN